MRSQAALPPMSDTVWKLLAGSFVAGAVLFWIAAASLAVYYVCLHSMLFGIGCVMPLMFEGAARRSFAIVLWFWPEIATSEYLAKHPPQFNFSRRATP